MKQKPESFLQILRKKDRYCVCDEEKQNNQQKHIKIRYNKTTKLLLVQEGNFTKTKKYIYSKYI
jgi:hypothetical protein